jgi:hypothetical protein
MTTFRQIEANRRNARKSTGPVTEEGKQRSRCKHPTPRLIDSLPRKAISSVPELANRTPFALVVDSLLVRATDYPVGHHDRKHSMPLYKLQYLPGDYGVGTNVPAVHFPVAQLRHLRILGWHDANSNLRCLAQVRTIERNRRNRPTPQAFSGFLTQALKKSVFHQNCLPSDLFPHDWSLRSAGIYGINPFSNAIS